MNSREKENLNDNNMKPAKPPKTIDRLFKEKLENMEYNINEGSAIVFNYHLRTKRKKHALMWIFSISLLLLSTFGLYVWKQNIFQHTKKETHPPSVVNHNKNNPLSSYASVLNASATQPVITEKEQNTETANAKQNNYKSTQPDIIQPSSVHTASQENLMKTNNTSPQQLPFKDTTTYVQSYAHTFWKSEHAQPPIQVKVFPLEGGVNSAYPEYAPVINADGTILFYTSRRPVEGTKKKSKLKESIFISELNEKTKTWSSPQLAPYPLNKDERYASAVGVSNDGQQLFIYQDDETGNGDIYISRLKGKEWTELEKLPEPINSQYLETTVSLSPDGNMLFIASNRPGGYGGLDIWYSVKNKDGKWSKPVNLGPAINTAGNEEGCFIHPDGKTLYFHSNGHGGFGGYDIFYSTFENGKWSKPINMGEPINGPDHDVYFTIDAAKEFAYFSSKRQNGKGETDIYKVEFISEETTKEKIKTPALTLFKGKVLDKQTLEPLEANIEITDVDKNQIITTLHSNAATGKFMMSLPAGKNYAININKKDYLFYSESFLIDTTATYNEVEKIIYLDKLKKGAKVILNNIFYDYDKATLREASKSELDKVYELMQQNPSLVIEFSAHTDSRGNDAYNLQLSQKRAQSCVDYLINKGISKNRLIAKGYGETQPVITDEEINKLTTEEEKEAAHQQNRRTEIKIIEN